jgi:hypothetical protein
LALQVTGRVVEVLEEQSGTGKNGPWRKQDFVLETEGEYQNPICMTQWGDNIEKFDLKVGDTLTAHIDLRSREYNGRWYTDVKAWKVDKQAAEAGPGAPAGEAPPLPIEDSGGDDDLPF